MRRCLAAGILGYVIYPSPAYSFDDTISLPTYILCSSTEPSSLPICPCIIHCLAHGNRFGAGGLEHSWVRTPFRGQPSKSQEACCLGRHSDTKAGGKTKDSLRAELCAWARKQRKPSRCIRPDSARG